MPQPEHETDTDGQARRCILTGVSTDPDGLIRLVQAPDGRVLPDLARKLPGRGAWIAPDRRLLSSSVAKGRLKGALARSWRVDANAIGGLEQLPALIDSLLARRARDRLGLEKRAGQIVLGADSIREALARGKVAALLHASDAAADGVAKLSGRSDAEVLPPALTRAELSLAFGRENVVHAAVIDTGAARRLAGVLYCLLSWRRSLDDATPETKTH